MGAFGGPTIVDDGLVLSLDAGNTKSYDKYENLSPYSESLDNWANNGNAINISANSSIAPNGTLTADVLSQTTVTGAGRWLAYLLDYNYVSGVTYTLSIWLKKISGTDAQPQINLWVNGFTNQSVGTITTEWVRYSATFTASSTSNLGTYTGFNVVWNSNGTANNFTFAAWGFQLEIGSTVTDYYPTTTTAKTRGTTLTDLSSRGNNGTLTNGVDYNINNLGSFVFDSELSNRYIQTPSFDFTFTGDYTISIWFYLNDLGPDTYGATVLLSTGASGSNDQIFIDGGGEGIVGRIWHGNTTFTDIVDAENDAYLTKTIPVIEINKWTNLVITRIGTSLKCYVNNELKVTRVSIGTIGRVGPMRIGQRVDNGHPVLGKISQVSIYKNRGLTAEEVSQNFNALRGRYGI